METRLRMIVAGMGAGCLALLAGCGGGAGEADEPSAESAERAAADSEYDAAAEFRSLRAAMSAELVDALSGWGGELTQRVRQGVVGTSGVTDRLIWATRLPKADWGIDYEIANVDTPLDHLAPLRDLGRLLRAEGKLADERGDTERAAEAAAALVRMSEHVDGETGIESLVAIATLYAGASAAIEIAPSLTAPQKAALRSELQRMSGDPFNIERAIEFDRRMLAGRSDVEIADGRMREAAADAAERVQEALRALR